MNLGRNGNDRTPVNLLNLWIPRSAKNFMRAEIFISVRCYISNSYIGCTQQSGNGVHGTLSFMGNICGWCLCLNSQHSGRICVTGFFLSLLRLSLFHIQK